MHFPSVRKAIGHFLFLFFYVKVHENGSSRETDPTIHLNLRNLPSKHADQTPIEYLLDYLQTSLELFSRQRPRRIFDVTGNEVKLMGQLKSKQHIFVSYGEEYRPAFGKRLLSFQENRSFVLIVKREKTGVDKN